MSNYKQGRFLLLATCYLLLLSACGFHLRGSVTLQAQLPVTHITGSEGAIQNEVRRQLVLSGVKLTEDAQQAGLVVRLQREQIDRRVLSVGATGKVEEYEVHYALSYSAARGDGAALVESETLDYQRAYTYNQAEVLAKDTEQETLVNDMRRQAVRQLILRVQAAIRAPVATEPAVIPSP